MNAETSKTGGIKKKIRKFLKITILVVAGVILTAAAYLLPILYLNKKAKESAEIIPQNEKFGKRPLLLPSYFVDGQHFYLKIPVTGGDTLLGFCDTGGGISFLLPSETEKEPIRKLLRSGILMAVMPMDFICFRQLVPDADFPKPYPLRTRVIRQPFSRITEPYLIVPPEDGELKDMAAYMQEMDVFFAQDFFMNKAWTLDYPGRQIWVHTPVPANEAGMPHVEKLAFLKNKNGDKLFGHPYFKVEIDGDTLDMLFDTGATLRLTDAGKKVFGNDKRILAGSFIGATIFEKWRKKHPDWKVYPNAEAGGDIMEVPKVKIGGHEVGPVRFIANEDGASTLEMEETGMYAEGAIGGSALQYLKVMIDYNSELVKFIKPEAKNL